jgi:hypothetical protein
MVSSEHEISESSRSKVGQAILLLGTWKFMYLACAGILPGVLVACDIYFAYNVVVILHVDHY